MSEFKLDTAGYVADKRPLMADGILCWADLSPFVQGYVEAILRSGGGYVPELGECRPWDFKQLAPETLARSMEDCAQRVADLARCTGIQPNSDLGYMFWSGRQRGDFGSYFPPLIVALNDAGKVVFQ